MQPAVAYVAQQAVTLLGLAIVFQLLAWLTHRPWSRRRLGVSGDVAFFFLHGVFSKAAVALSFLALVAFGIQPSQPLFAQLADLPLALQAVLAFVLWEFVIYWLHRGLHHLPLWRVHAVHHSSRTLDWLSTYRMHPLEVMAYSLILPVLFWLGLSPVAFVWVGLVRLVHNALVHADVPWRFGPLGYVITSPVFHRWHHETAAAAQGKNFASGLALYDVLFGTYYCPRDTEPRRFGITDPVPEGFIRQLAYPLRGATPESGNEPPSVP